MAIDKGTKRALIAYAMISILGIVLVPFSVVLALVLIAAAQVIFAVTYRRIRDRGPKA